MAPRRHPESRRHGAHVLRRVGTVAWHRGSSEPGRTWSVRAGYVAVAAAVAHEGPRRAGPAGPRRERRRAPAARAAFPAAFDRCSGHRGHADRMRQLVRPRVDTRWIGVHHPPARAREPATLRRVGDGRAPPCRAVLRGGARGRVHAVDARAASGCLASLASAAPGGRLLARVDRDGDHLLFARRRQAFDLPAADLSAARHLDRERARRGDRAFAGAVAARAPHVHGR